VLTAGPALTPDTHVVFRIGAKEVVADRTRGRLLASMSAQSGPFGGSIVSIDPALGEVGPPVFVGNRPSQLAVSDDGKYLYVGYEGLAEVRRFELPTFRHDLTIPLGADGWSGVRFAKDLAIRPAHSSEVSVARGPVGSRAGVSFFRDGQPLAEGIGEGTVDFLAFSGAGRLYGYSDSFGLLRLAVDDTGMQSLGFLQNVVQFGTPGFTVANGRVYFSGGSVFDGESGQSVGRFNMLFSAATAPLVEPASRRAVFVERGLFDTSLAVYDDSTFARIGTNVLHGFSVASSSLCQWSADGLAFLASSGVVLVRTTLIGVSEQPARFESVSVSSGMVTLRVNAQTPGQYQLEHTTTMGGTWSALGEPFAEGTRELQIPTGTATQEFFRLIRLPP